MGVSGERVTLWSRFSGVKRLSGVSGQSLERVKGRAFALGEPTNYARSYSELHHGQAHFFPASN